MDDNMSQYTMGVIITIIEIRYIILANNDSITTFYKHRNCKRRIKYFEIKTFLSKQLYDNHDIDEDIMLLADMTILKLLLTMIYNNIVILPNYRLLYACILYSTKLWH